MKRSDIPTKAVLMACNKFHKERGLSPFQILINEFNAPEKVVYAAMERESKKGLIEYGVSLRLAWITEKGNDVLNGHTFTVKRTGQDCPAPNCNFKGSTEII